jgi:hypothetical protein
MLCSQFSLNSPKAITEVWIADIIVIIPYVAGFAILEFADALSLYG